MSSKSPSSQHFFEELAEDVRGLIGATWVPSWCLRLDVDRRPGGETDDLGRTGHRRPTSSPERTDTTSHESNDQPLGAVDQSQRAS